MRVCWLDCSVAAAGDMILASLLDAGADLAYVRAGLASLGLDGWRLELDEVHRGAFRAARAKVTVGGQEEGVVFFPWPRASSTGRWSEIRARITESTLPERARDRALRAYERLAAAEARLHGMPIDDVVLHEVGSIDAVIDIVGTCLALESLGIEQIIATPLPMGQGSVVAAHGTIPLPAPATLEVCRGWPVVAGPPGEWVTPTGAALVTALAQPGSIPACTIVRIGHGAGKRDPKQVANLVRAVVGEASARHARDTVIELACNLDDAPGTLIGATIAALLADGALDAWATPITMKKGRPGVMLSCLAREADADRLAERILRETPTLGVRRSTRSRDVLERWFETVQTPWGPVRVKVGGRDGVAFHAEPEPDDVLALATASGEPLQRVHAAAVARWFKA